jgi:2'-5' RNA ligase
MIRLKRYSDFMSLLEDKSGTMYEYGCLMVYLDLPNWSKVVSNIDKRELYEPSSERYGIETEPHITILYGIHSDVSDGQVIELFEGVKKTDFDITVNGIDCFFNKDYDVLKMDVKSNKLNELNELCKTLPHTSAYPDYKPHITIAYLLKGNGSKYMNPTFQMKMNNIDKIVYSKPNGEKIDISLDERL